MENNKSKEMAKLAIQALEDKKAEDIKVIDISEVSVIADYFIIADGANQNQLQAMCDSVEEELYKAGCKLKQTEGNRNSTWILMDYGDVIVHLFYQQTREFYNLDKLWSDGTKIDIQTLLDGPKA